MTNHSAAARISFRRLETSDLPLMFHWLNQSEVKRWYDDPSDTLADVQAHFGPSIAGTESTRPFLILRNERPIGYIQTYLPKDRPDDWSKQNLPDSAAGIDLFIGEDDTRHLGLGAPIIRAFIAQILAPDPTITEIIIDPDPANTIAIRAYEKAGFTRLREIGPPEHYEPALLMTRKVRD
jgi:aminoglycoside 6'-N-acetyltransferase